MQFLNQFRAELKYCVSNKKALVSVLFLSYSPLLQDFLQQIKANLGSESQGQIIERADQKGRAAFSNIGSIGSEELKSAVMQGCRCVVLMRSFLIKDVFCVSSRKFLSAIWLLKANSKLLTRKQFHSPDISCVLSSSTRKLLGAC